MQLDWKIQHLDENYDNMLNVEEEFFCYLVGLMGCDLGLGI
jgi:hypothetical protein